MIPHARAIIPKTNPAVAIPFLAGFFLAIAPRMIATTPQAEPSQPKLKLPPITEERTEIIPKLMKQLPFFTSLRKNIYYNKML